MTHGEVLKAVFPLLDGKDLASCMQVSKQWRDIAIDDYFWKCLCAKRWPSICKKHSPPPLTYHKLYLTFSKRLQRQTFLPPRLSFDNLEFYVDIWAEDASIFSEVVPGPVLRTKIPLCGIPDMLRFHLEGPDYKMTIPVVPRFTVPLGQTISVSVLVGRNDSNKIARIVNKSLFDYIDRTAHRALAFDYLDFSPLHPFISGIRAWVSLLFTEEGNDSLINVFGVQMDFCDVANSEEEVLWLLDMLDWK
ncbi:F-box domain [Macleaya cordata]|uniref:F-box domain n=1 Tax=Macleaya cordata TaxID=56857 RepID=A0A200PRF3_MACCD|nr:F-box domain [Macleaya cordata]